MTPDQDRRNAGYRARMTARDRAMRMLVLNHKREFNRILAILLATGDTTVEGR